MPDDMLTVQEAAVVSGVDARMVNDAIDRDVIPAGLFTIDPGRRITPEGCVVVSFYNDTQATLTRSFRIEVIHQLAEHLRANRNPHPRGWSSSMMHLLTSKQKLVVRSANGLSVDLQPFAQKIKAGTADLEEAVAMANQDKDVCCGAPCIRNTRIQIHDVATSVQAGVPTADIMAAYPDLTERDITLADLYARAHPARGRPRLVDEALPSARLTFEKSIRRDRRV